MAKSTSKRSSGKTESPLKTIIPDQTISIPRKILKVKAFTPICKPLNGSLPSSKISHLLKLWTFEYQYKNGKETKTSTATAYMIKGLRGALRHQVMTHCKERGLEVCHTSDKETDQKGNSLLPEGFHLLGSCTDSDECIVHAVFGSKGNSSKIRVSAKPIANISHKTFQAPVSIQNVQIATEKRVALTFEGKAIQDFGERYLAGEFEFEIDITKCTPEEMGMIIEATMYMHKLGGGYNAGYAELQIKGLDLVKSTTNRQPKITDQNSFTIEEEIDEEKLPEEFTNALTAWKKHLREYKEVK